MLYKNKRRLIFVLLIISLIILYLFKNYSLLLRIGTFILWIIVLYAFDHAFRLHFPPRHYIYFIIILTFGILLSPLYSIYEIYDKILHLAMPIFGCIIVFFVLGKSKLEFKWKLIITMTVIITAITMLEVGEYLFDMVWDLKLQGVYIRDATGLDKYILVLGKNDDTMIDMIMGIAGTLIFIAVKTVGYFYRKNPKKEIRH